MGPQKDWISYKYIYTRVANLGVLHHHDDDDDDGNDDDDDRDDDDHNDDNETTKAYQKR